VPKCVVAVEDPAAPLWLVGGACAADITKAMHSVNAHSGATTEDTALPTAGSIECMTIDTATGIAYALVADSNKSVLVRDMTTGVWTVLGVRGAGAQTPAAGTTFFAANNGLLVIAYNNAGVKIEYITASPFVRTLRTHPSADGTDVCDLKYSKALGAWSLLTKQFWYTFVDPAGAFQTWKHTTNGSGTTLADGGCLTDTGCLAWVDTVASTRGIAYVRDWPGEDARTHKYGTMGSSITTVTFAAYDGSALWLYTNRAGTQYKLFRSLRSA
jgi:hypothetical protein